MQLTYTPGGVDDPFSTSNPGYVPGQGPVSPAPPPVYQPPAPAPVYTPQPYSDAQFIQDTQPPLPSYGTAPAPSNPVYVPEPYVVPAQQYVLGAGAQTDSDLGYITDVAQQYGYRPTYADVQAAQGQYDQQASLSGLDQSFYNTMGQQNATDMANTAALAQDTNPYLQSRYGQYLLQNNIAPRTDAASGEQFYVQPQHPGLVNAGMQALSTFGSAEQSFGLPKLDVPILGDTIDAALSPLSLAGFGLGLEAAVANEGLRVGGLTALKEAATRGLPAIAGATAASEGFNQVPEAYRPYLGAGVGAATALLAPSLLGEEAQGLGRQAALGSAAGLLTSENPALAGNFIGGAAGAVAPALLAKPALRGLEAASSAVARGADRLGLVPEGGVPGAGMVRTTDPGSNIPGMAADEAAGTGLSAARAPGRQTARVEYSPQPSGTPFRDLPVVDTMDDVMHLRAEAEAAGETLFVRWSRGSDLDARGGTINTQVGVGGNELAGRSAMHLSDDPYAAAWEMSDYGASAPEKARPYLLTGDIVGAGPDGEPLVANIRPVAVISPSLEGSVTEARGLMRDAGRSWSAEQPAWWKPGGRARDYSFGAASNGDPAFLRKLGGALPETELDRVLGISRPSNSDIAGQVGQRPQITFEGGTAPEGAGAELGSGLGAVAPGRDTAVGRAAAKVAPGMFQVDAGRAEAGVGARPVGEAGTRPGSLLRLPGEEQMPANYTAKDVTRVAARGERAVGSQTVRLSGEANAAFRDLGGMVKQDGNWYLRDVQPSAAEQAAGKQLALAQRVLERPEEYSLTPKQRAAVDKLAGLAERVTNERDAYGAPVQRMTLDEGEKFFWRKGTQDTKGRELTRPSGPSGKRLSVPKTQHRLFDDPMDAVKEGVRYEDPRKTFTEKTRSNLQAAVNQHVANLLDKFAQTPADRVPEALRQRVEGLRQKLSSLKQTTARLDDRTQAAIDQFIKTPNDAVVLDDLRDALRQKVGVNAVGKAGPNFGKDAQAMRQTIAQVKQDLETLAPAWRRAVAQSKAVPPDRATVPQNLAPRLIGRDFAPDVAKTITRYYSKGALPENQVGTVVKGIRILNRTIVPLRAIGDASATLNQLALMAASHPVAFMKNFGLALRDSFKDVPYERWLQKPEVADFASHGGELLGEGNVGSEFQLSNWLQKVPLLRESNKHFERFTNRMRVDAYDSIVKTMERQGQRVDGAAKDQLVNAVNRASGISVSKAGDVEGLAQFAPNFLRAHIENIVKAVSDGTLEGQVARQYLKNLVVLGSTGVIMAAIAQKRDLKEVLTPFTVRDGRLSLNPNFMTVRVGGQDVSVFGSYDSLARLAVVAGDAVNGAIQDKDAMQLFDAIGYAASTKGAPWVQLASDLIKGETFTGADPLSWQEGIKRVIPFTGSQAIEDVQKGMSPGQTALDVGLGFFGAKSNPLTLTEQLNEASGGDFYGRLSSGEKPEAVLKDHPDLLKQYQDREAQRLKDAQGIVTGSDAGKTVGFNALQEAKAARDTAISDAAGTFDQATQAAGGDAVAQARAGQDFRAALSDANQAYRIRSESAGQWLLGDRVATTDEAKALSAYFDAGDAYRNSSGKVTDYDGMAKAQAAAYAGLSPAGKAAVDAALAKGDVNQPQAVKDYYGALDKLGADGYFDVTSGLADWRSSHPEDDALIRKYGYGESTTKYLDTRSELATQQAASDQMLASGQLSKEQWRNDLGDRKQQLVGAASGAYGTGDFTPTEQTALTGYHSAIDGATGADGKVDWDKVDAWVSSQPQDVQDAINNRATFALSPMAAQYASDMKALDAAGYFDQKDQAWQVFVQKADPEFTGTEAEFWPYVRQFYQDDAKRYLDEHEPGWEQTEPQAQGMIANLYVQRLESAYGQIAGAYNKQWRVQNPQEAQLYYKWFDVGAAETGFAVQQGNNVPVEQP